MVIEENEGPVPFLQTKKNSVGMAVLMPCRNWVYSNFMKGKGRCRMARPTNGVTPYAACPALKSKV